MGYNFENKSKAIEAGKSSSRKGVKNKFPNKLEREAKLTALENFITSVSRGNYYVYYHIDNLDDRVFYIGMGCGNRAWDKSSRNDMWKEYTSVCDYRVSLLASNLSKEEALAIEEALIKINKPLTNIHYAI